MVFSPLQLSQELVGQEIQLFPKSTYPYTHSSHPASEQLRQGKLQLFFTPIPWNSGLILIFHQKKILIVQIF